MRAIFFVAIWLSAAPAFADASVGERRPGSAKPAPDPPPVPEFRIKEPLVIRDACETATPERDAADRTLYLAAMTRLFKECSARIPPTHWGPFGYRITIQPSGKTSDASFDGEPAALGRCLAARSKTLRFAARCGEVRLAWPIAADATH